MERGSTKEISEVMLHLDQVFADAPLYESVQRRIVTDSVRFHVAKNQKYRVYYESFGLEDPSSEFALTSVPLLPSALFKRRGLDLVTVPTIEIIKQCTSSGTRGSISRVPRDEETLTNFLGSITSATACLYGVERGGGHKALVLGPDPAESGDLWFSYVLSSMALNFHTEYFEHSGEFDVEVVIARLEEAFTRGRAVFLVGPPFRILDLCQQLKRQRRPLHAKEGSYVITAGGWKNREKRAVSRVEYTKLVGETLGLNATFIRDSYNMVELNTVMSECEVGEKHAPPWVHVAARDPRTNEPLADGKTGILSFCDGSATSYPCFLLSEDYGTVTVGCCRCGRVGQRVNVLRRMEGIEARGCALKMAGAPENGTASGGADRFFKSFYRRPDWYRR